MCHTKINGVQQLPIDHPCHPSSAVLRPWEWLWVRVRARTKKTIIYRLISSSSAPRTRTLDFLDSFSFFSVFAFEMAASRCCDRTAAVWFRLAAIAARSAPTIPRWCLTVFRERFLATSSVIPFLCMRRYTCVHAIFRGFLRWRKREAVLEVEKRKT
jgi:hypothetical protein